MSYYFKQTKRSARIKFHEQLYKLSMENNVPFVFDDEMNSVVSTSLYNDSGKVEFVRIGNSDVKYDNFISGLKSVDDVLFSQILLNMYHEESHVQQANVDFQNSYTDIYTMRNAVSLISQWNNREYYIENGNYNKNSNEIKAEYDAFSKLQAYLNVTFSNLSSDKIDEVLLQLVDKKCNDGSYFIKQPECGFQSMESVYCAFEDAYINSFQSCKLYTHMNTNDYNDSFKDLMLKNDIVKTVYLNAKSREEQDKIVACGNILLHPEYEHIYPCLDDVDLSYEAVINKPYIDYQRQHHIETEDEANKRLFGDKSSWNKSESKVRRSISERLDALADRLDLNEKDSDKEFE